MKVSMTTGVRLPTVGCVLPISTPQQVRMSQHEALAERVQEILAARHGIRSERHAGDGVAMLIISTELVAWFYPQSVQWQTGHKSTRHPGHAIMATASVNDPPETIARRLAERYRQIRQAVASGPAIPRHIDIPA